MLKYKKGMSKKPIFIVAGFLLMIFALGKYSTWQIEKWKKSLPSEFPTIAPEEIPKITQLFPTSTFPLQFPTSTYPLPESFSYPGMTQPTSSQEIKIEEFISPDGKLKIKYPSNFVKLEVRNLRKAVPEEMAENYKMEIIFLAQRFSPEKPAQILIDQMFIGIEKELKEILKELKEAAEKQGWEMGIIKSEEKNGQLNFEATYKKQTTSPFHSEGKMLSFELENNQKKVFMVEIVTEEKNWASSKEEFDEILNSAQLVK
jgi:hypothetical protein